MRASTGERGTAALVLIVVTSRDRRWTGYGVGTSEWGAGEKREWQGLAPF
jgi:hypothetical protein